MSYDVYGGNLRKGYCGLEEERMQIWYKEFEEFHKIQEYNNEQQ